MEVYSDLPGVQFYAGNNIGTDFGKADALYQKRSGLCLETQFFPNSANQEGFIKPVIGPEKPFTSTTIYKFV
jgi:aldose 1-epimerase